MSTEVSTPNATRAGFYYLSEAARLAELHSQRVKRWVAGYRYPTKTGNKDAPPLFKKQGMDTDRVILSFLDLIEIRFVREFLRHGVSFDVIRVAQREAAEEFKVSHPFCVKRFETEGTTIVERMQHKGREILLDRGRTRDRLIEQVVNPLLLTLDYAGIDEEAERWWPLGKGEAIVIDPQRAFGDSIVARTRVPTRLVLAARNAGEPVERIAEWYELTVEEVHAALRFETEREPKKRRRRPAAA